MAPPIHPVYWDGKGPDVGDDAWLLSAGNNGHNPHLKPNLVGLDINTMQYNGMGNRFASQERYKQLIQAHGALAAVAFLFLVPIAVMMGQFRRGRNYGPRGRRQQRGRPRRGQRQGRREWLQARLDLASVIVATATFVLCFEAVGRRRMLTNPHHIIGVALYVMLLVRFVLGACWVRPRTEGGRPSMLGTWIHQWLGRLTTLLGLAQVPLGLCLYGAAQVFFILYAVVAGALVLLYLGLSYVYEDESTSRKRPYVPSDIKGSTPEPLVNAPSVSGAITDAGQTVSAKGLNLDSVEDVPADIPTTRVNGLEKMKTSRETTEGAVKTAIGVGIASESAPASGMTEEGQKETESYSQHGGWEHNNGGEKYRPEGNGAHKKIPDSVNRARKSRAGSRFSVKPRDEQLESSNRPSPSPPSSTPPAGHPVAGTGPSDIPKIKTNLTVPELPTALIQRDDMQPWETRDKKPPLNTATTLSKLRAPNPKAENQQLFEEEAQSLSASIESDTETHEHVSGLENNDGPISNITSVTTSQPVRPQEAHTQEAHIEEGDPQGAPEPVKKKKRTIIRKKLIKKPAANPAPPAKNDDDPPTVPDEPDQPAHSRLSSWDNIPEHYRLDGDETDGQSVASYLWDAESAAHRRAFALRRHPGILGPAAPISYPLPGVLEVPQEPGPSQPSGAGPRPISRSGSKNELETEDEVEADNIEKATNKTVPSQPQSRPISVTIPAAILPRPVARDGPNSTTTRPHELRRVRPATENGYAEALAYMYRDRPRPEPEEIPGFVPYLAANDDRYRRAGE